MFDVSGRDMSESAADLEAARSIRYPEMCIPLSGLWAGFGCVQEPGDGQMKLAMRLLEMWIRFVFLAAAFLFLLMFFMSAAAALR